MKLGHLIRQARQGLGMTQRDLAEHLGCNYSAVGAWEVDANEPDVENKIGLAAVLGIPFTDLLDLAPGVGERVEVVTDPELLAILRLVKREPPDRRSAMLRAIALLLERLEKHPALTNPAPPRGREKVR